MWGPEAIRDPFHEACNQSAKPDTRTSSRSADLAGTGPSVAAFWDHDVKNNNLRMKRHDEQVHHDNRPECRSFQHQTEPQANSQGAVAIQTRRKLDGYELAQAAAGRPRHGARATQGVRSSAPLVKNLSALVGALTITYRAPCRLSGTSEKRDTKNSVPSEPPTNCCVFFTDAKGLGERIRPASI